MIGRVVLVALPRVVYGIASPRAIGAVVHGCSCHCVLGYFTVKHPCFGSGVFFMVLCQATLADASSCGADCVCCARATQAKAIRQRMATNLLGGDQSHLHGRGVSFRRDFPGQNDLHWHGERDPAHDLRNGYLAILVHQQANERLTTTGVSNRTIAQAAFQRQGISRFSVTMAFTM